MKTLPCFFRICDILDKVQLISQDGRDYVGQCGVVSIHPQFHSSNGLKVFSHIAKDMGGGYISIVINTVIHLLLAKGGNVGGIRVQTFNVL